MFRKTFRAGFTLVELSLSLAFIGILSISVVLIISNTVVAYRRGLMLSQINSSGIEIVDDMRSAVQNAPSRSLSNSCAMIYTDLEERAKCENDGAYKLVSLTKTSQVKINNGRTTIAASIFGVFCTGSYSYIWNSGYFESDDATFDEKNNGWIRLEYTDGEGNVVKIGQTTPPRLLKIRDNARMVCAVAMDSDGENYAVPSSGINNTIDITGYGSIVDEPEDLLTIDSGGNLVLYDLQAVRPVEDMNKKNALYMVSFVLGTNSGGANVMAKGNSCVTPEDYGNENSDYCSINKFNFAAQVNGG